MINENPFPESPQKAYLRRIHLQYLAKHRDSRGRELAYLGLPSAEMVDVKLWRNLLGHITAVERDPDVALAMRRTAQMIGVRPKTVIIERGLGEVADFLALDNKFSELAIAALPIAEQDDFRRARKIGYDVINLDLCGGFLYPKHDKSSENADILTNLIRHQTRHKQAFIFILTFQLRDAGKEEYLSFISESLQLLREASGIDTSEVEKFYTAGRIPDQPPNLRRLRFCVPTFLHKLAYESFKVASLGGWYYKKMFYHTALFFEPRQGQGTLGMPPWPPLKEFKELLRTPMKLIEVGTDEEGVEILELPAPMLP